MGVCFLTPPSPKKSVLKYVISTMQTRELCSFALTKVTYISIKMLIFVPAIAFQV